MIHYKTQTKIVATILAKNEEDIIGLNIEHHLSQGVTHFIVTDNASSDNTRKILEGYPEVVDIIDELGDDHRQSEWVTRMAKMACKLNPDWIIHLDADELWCGLSQLKHVPAKAIGSTKMFLHPPTTKSFSMKSMRYYLDFENIPELPGECKVAHRPDPDIVITHGNHGFESGVDVLFTKDIWRHHYPVRSYEQFERKCVNGHRALLNRNAVCERWKKWHDLQDRRSFYDGVCKAWQEMIDVPNKVSLQTLLSIWCEPEVIEFFNSHDLMPTLGEWPQALSL